VFGDSFDLNGDGKCDVVVYYDSYPADEPTWRKEVPWKYFFAENAQFKLVYEETITGIEIRHTPYAYRDQRNGGPPYLVVSYGMPTVEKFMVWRWNPAKKAFDQWEYDLETPEKSDPIARAVMQAHRQRAQKVEERYRWGPDGLLFYEHNERKEGR
jgi:hypothetical protein